MRLRRDPDVGTLLEGKYAGMYVLRVGKYKIVYEVYKKQLSVLVIKIGRKMDITDMSWLVQLRS